MRRIGGLAGVGLRGAWVEEEKDRSGGVEDVDCGDAAVGEIFLCEEHGVAVGVGDEFVSGDGLAIGEDGDCSVVIAAGFDEVGGEFGVEGRGAGFEVGILRFGFVEHLFDGHVVALPVGAEISLEVLDGVALGVRNEEMPCDGLGGDGAKIEDRREMGGGAVRCLGYVHRVADGELPGGGESLGGMRCDGGGVILVARNRETEVAPVDTQVVSGAVEDLLVLGADGEDIERRGLVAERGDGLAGVVDGDEGVDVEKQGDLMGCSIGRLCGPRQVGDGAGE